MMLRLTPTWWRCKASLLFGVKSKTQQFIFLKKVLQEVRKGLICPVSNCSANTIQYSVCIKWMRSTISLYSQDLVLFLGASIYYSVTVQSHCSIIFGQMTSTVKNVYFSLCYICFLFVLHFASTFELNSIVCHIQLQNWDKKKIPFWQHLLAIAEAVQWLLFSVADSITRTGFSQFNYGTEQHLYYSARVNKLKS